MAYNPSLYNPYGQQVQVTMQPMQQPAQHRFPTQPIVQVNNIEEAAGYPVMPGSCSPALFFADEDKFAFKTMDANGNVSVKVYSYQEETPPDPMAGYVTVDTFTAAIQELKEAINGKFALTADAVDDAGADGKSG